MKNSLIKLVWTQISATYNKLLAKISNAIDYSNVPISSWKISNRVIPSFTRKTADLGSIVFLSGGSADNDKYRGGNATALLKPEECVDNYVESISGGNITVHHVHNDEPVNDNDKPVIDNNTVTPKKRRKFFKKKERTIDPSSSAATYSKKLKNRNSLNIKRKFTHAAFGFLFAGLNHFIPSSTFVPAMAILSGGTLFMEMMRYRKGFGWMNDALHFVLGSSLRKHEMEGKFTGSLYYFLGVTSTSALFPKTAATMGIFQLAIADPSASYFGRKTRHIYWSRIDRGFFGLGRNKGILGFLGGALACVPLNYYVLRIAHWGVDGVPGGQLALIAASLGLGLAGAFADLAVPTPALTLPHKICGIPVPPFHVDDNVVVPVVSGFACTKIFQLLGWDQHLELAKFIFL